MCSLSRTASLKKQTPPPEPQQQWIAKSLSVRDGKCPPTTTAVILVGLILCRCYACRLRCCEHMCAMALPCPSKDSHISFSCPLFFFFQTFLLTLPSPSDHVTLSFRLYSQLFRIRPRVGKNRFV